LIFFDARLFSLFMRKGSPMPTTARHDPIELTEEDGGRMLVIRVLRDQRIMMFPRDGLVVTMTAIIEDDERSACDPLLRDDVFPALAAGPVSPTEASLHGGELAKAVARADRQPSRLPSTAEHRMIPDATPKGQSGPYGASAT